LKIKDLIDAQGKLSCFSTMPMLELKQENSVSIALGAIGAAFVALCFGDFFQALLHTWLHDEQFSYSLLIPPIVGYLVWNRRDRLAAAPRSGWAPGFLIVGVGCVLQVLASRSGTLLLSGIALITALIGISGFLWGRNVLRIAAGPLALLILMVPLPSYVVGQLTWYLQGVASSVSGRILDLIGVPVVQDGNLLRLPNYVLEVKQACSGSNSIIALVALALVIGINSGGKWWRRAVLLLAAPILAVGANVTRIVGTGLLARHWGDLVENESLHAAWGVVVFLTGVSGLLAINSLQRARE
jgi:exosortase